MSLSSAKFMIAYSERRRGIISKSDYILEEAQPLTIITDSMLSFNILIIIERIISYGLQLLELQQLLRVKLLLGLDMLVTMRKQMSMVRKVDANSSTVGDLHLSMILLAAYKILGQN